MIDFRFAAPTTLLGKLRTITPTSTWARRSTAAERESLDLTTSLFPMVVSRPSPTRMMAMVWSPMFPTPATPLPPTLPPLTLPPPTTAVIKKAASYHLNYPSTPTNIVKLC